MERKEEKGLVGTFEVDAEDLLGRTGKLYTAHGVVRTPALVPVIDPAKNVLDAAEIRSVGFDMVITNAYLIKQHYGDLALELGVRGVLGTEGVVMTDSGAYQLLVYGSVDVDPREIVLYQVKLGSDIGVVLDIPTRLGLPKSIVREEVEETLKRVNDALSMDLGDMLLVGPVQGGLYLDIVAYSASVLSKLDVDIFAVGGPTQLLEGYRYSDLVRLVMTAKMNLSPEKPLHLFGAGHPMIIPFIVAMGVDMFDSASYALYARDGRYMLSHGTYRLEELNELPCHCPVCSKYCAKELRELPREEREVELARHNLYVLKRELSLVRQAITEGTLWNLLESRAKSHPALYAALQTLRRYVHYIEKSHPLTHVNVSAEFFFDANSRYRPSVYRYFVRLRDRYTPPSGRIALLLPDWPSRPFSRFGWTAELIKGLPEGLRAKVHALGLSPAYGIVPVELEGVYPTSQYEIPDDPTELLEDAIRDVAWFFRRYKGSYRGVVIVTYERFLGLARKLSLRIKEVGLESSIVIKHEEDAVDVVSRRVVAELFSFLEGTINNAG